MITVIAMILEKSTSYMKRGKLISVDSYGSDDCNNDWTDFSLKLRLISIMTVKIAGLF